MRAAPKANRAVLSGKRGAQARVLARLAEAARQCQEVEEELGKIPAPELEAIIRQHRRLILKYSLEAEKAPEQLKLVKDLMKPVMDWARLERRGKTGGATAGEPGEEGAGLKPATLEKIERELRLL